MNKEKDISYLNTEAHRTETSLVYFLIAKNPNFRAHQIVEKYVETIDPKARATTIKARISELKKAGYIYASGRSKDPETHKMCETYSINGDLVDINHNFVRIAPVIAGEAQSALKLSRLLLQVTKLYEQAWRAERKDVLSILNGVLIRPPESETQFRSELNYSINKAKELLALPAPAEDEDDFLHAA